MSIANHFTANQNQEAKLNAEIFSSRNKVSVFVSMEDDIRKVYPDPVDQERVKKMLKEAEDQSKARRVLVTRKVEPLRKFIVLWAMRFKYGLHLRKAGYLFRIIRNVARGKIYNLLGIKKFILRGIEFAITFRCNFNCNHCLCARIDETNKRAEMVPEDYARVVKEAMTLGATTFGMEGGEPFIRKDWAEFIKAWQPMTNHIIITTNGSLCTREKIQEAYDLGVDTINFSLDSGYAELHNVFRKRAGSFEKNVENVHQAKEIGLKVIINTCVHKGNLYTDGFRELLEFCEREKILCCTLFAKGVGNFHNKDVMLDAQDIENYKKIVEPYAYVTRHLNFNYGNQWGCPGTKEMINMTPYGDVMNCANMHIYMGNVMKESLEVARKRGLTELPFGRYHECFLADDPDFMAVYYSKLEQQGSMTIKEFRDALSEYEKETGKTVYPGMGPCGKCQPQHLQDSGTTATVA